MYNYLKKIMRLIETSEGDADGMLVVNKEGIVEYIHPGKSGMPVFVEDAVGQRVLDLYPELNMENSTVMETLRTGKTVVGEKQVFTRKNYKVTLMATTYPIIENGSIEGAIDVAKFIDVKRTGKGERIDNGLYSLDDIISVEKNIDKMKRTIENVASNDSAVLIFGETGTGKQLVAESIHSLSQRKGKPFISQNCAAIPGNLMESIFFGTEKGSFTGAENKKGLFEMADGGTLFLDEVNSMDPNMQAKLLKALEEQKVRPLGARRDVSFDVRILCATNRDPESMVSSGDLRSDLYYRISVVRIDVPPLRERPEDIMRLTEHFIDHFNEKMDRDIKGVNLMVRRVFENWSWPGNVRELKNTVESAFNLEKSEYITMSSIKDLLRRVSQEEGTEARLRERNVPPGLPSELSSQKALEAALEKGVSMENILDQTERCIIEAAVASEGKLSQAAKKLGMSPQKLNYRLSKLNMREK